VQGFTLQHGDGVGVSGTGTDGGTGDTTGETVLTRGASAITLLEPMKIQIISAVKTRVIFILALLLVRKQGLCNRATYSIISS
jgi:hypothetical protein